MPAPLTIPGAEPFFFPGGKTGCLLIHGFTGTPKEMRWMGEYLAEQGHTVLGIRLAGHATQPADLLRTQWHDWLACVEDGLNLLRTCTEQQFLIGLSMGGVLTLLSAARYSVAGAIAISTPYDLPPDPRLRYIRLLRHLVREVDKGPSDWHNLSAAKVHIDYPSYPTLAIAELRDLLAEMRAALPLIKAPVLLVHSRQDQAVSPENMLHIYEILSTQNKEMLWVEDSGHVVTCEPERMQVFKTAQQFILKNTAEASHDD